MFPDGCIFCVLCIEAHIFIINSRDVRFVTNFLSRVQFCVIALERHISMWAVGCVYGIGKFHVVQNSCEHFNRDTDRERTHFGIVLEGSVCIFVCVWMIELFGISNG